MALDESSCLLCFYHLFPLPPGPAQYGGHFAKLSEAALKTPAGSWKRTGPEGKGWERSFTSQHILSPFPHPSLWPHSFPALIVGGLCQSRGCVTQPNHAWALGCVNFLCQIPPEKRRKAEPGSIPRLQVHVGVSATKQESKAHVEKQNKLSLSPGAAVTAAQPALGKACKLLLCAGSHQTCKCCRAGKELQVVPIASRTPPGLRVLTVRGAHSLMSPWLEVPRPHSQQPTGPKRFPPGFSLSPDVTMRNCGIQLTSVFLPLTVGVSLPALKQTCCHGRQMLAIKMKESARRREADTHTQLQGGCFVPSAHRGSTALPHQLLRAWE